MSDAPKAKKGVEYSEYLQIDRILGSQLPESRKAGREAHDETLFIVVHQVYELWFLQILHELRSIARMFGNAQLKDEALGVCVARLERVTRIQKLLLDQIPVLETMTPMDFLEFRDLLYPASGFQSFQFRLIENTLGLRADKRLLYERESYLSRLNESHRQEVLNSEKAPSIFALTETWLERTPFLQINDFSFWQSYRGTVERMLTRDEDTIRNNPHLNDEGKSSQLAQLAKTRANFEMIFDQSKLKTAIADGRWRLSHDATLASLFIYLYRDEPAVHLPFKFLSLLTDIDENFTSWRTRHAQMALRMIGTKIGTGGSSGAEYLSQAASAHRIFHDFSRLATFLIPRHLLPDLPPEVKKMLAFHYQVSPDGTLRQ